MHIYIYTINDLDGLILIINLLNGNMITNKIYALYCLIDWCSKHNNISIEKKPINKKSMENDAWLSGFIE